MLERNLSSVFTVSNVLPSKLSCPHIRRNVFLVSSCDVHLVSSCDVHLITQRTVLFCFKLRMCILGPTCEKQSIMWLRAVENIALQPHFSTEARLPYIASNHPDVHHSIVKLLKPPNRFFEVVHFIPI